MLYNILTCTFLLGSIFTVFSDELEATHSHVDSFLGNYAKNVLKWEPQKLEEILHWLVEHRIDQDKDMKVSEGELTLWMERIHYEALEKDIMDVFTDCNKKKDHDLTFKEYRICHNSKQDTPPPTEQSEGRLLARWRQADDDGNDKLSLEEFGVFYAPSEIHHQTMHGLLVDEYIDDRDSNGDVHLTFEEMTSVEPGDKTGDANSWERVMKSKFTTIDTDQDGLLSHPEIEHDMFPVKKDSLEEEARHIIADADDDYDGHIDLVEMRANLEMLIGSKVLQHGKILLRTRDEL